MLIKHSLPHLNLCTSNNKSCPKEEVVVGSLLLAGSRLLAVWIAYRCLNQPTNSPCCLRCLKICCAHMVLYLLLWINLHFLHSNRRISNFLHWYLLMVTHILESLRHWWQQNIRKFDWSDTGKHQLVLPTLTDAHWRWACSDYDVCDACDARDVTLAPTSYHEPALTLQWMMYKHNFKWNNLYEINVCYIAALTMPRCSLAAHPNNCFRIWKGTHKAW